MQTEYKVNIDDIYPGGYVCPAGYEFTGEFRPVKEGELWLSIRQSPGLCDLVTTAPYPRVNCERDYRPRLILRKSCPKTVTFRPTGEFRLPRQGEWYQSGPYFNLASGDHGPCDSPRYVYTRSES